MTTTKERFLPKVWIDEMIQLSPDGAIKATISKRDDLYFIGYL